MLGQYQPGTPPRNSPDSQSQGQGTGNEPHAWIRKVAATEPTLGSGHGSGISDLTASLLLSAGSLIPYPLPPPRPSQDTFFWLLCLDELL